MKFLVVLFLFLSTFAKADMDMAGFNIGFGQGTRPYFGIDYEACRGLLYIDLAILANQDYVQPYVSTGIQTKYVNIGMATALTGSQFSFGPELGYMENLSDLIYWKINNAYMGSPGNSFNYTLTFSVGVNF